MRVLKYHFTANCVCKVEYSNCNFFLIDLFAQFVASLRLYQLEFVEDAEDVIFPVEGVATIPLGGSPPRHFAFNCISTTSNGDSIVWFRTDGTQLTMQKLISKGVQLDFENAVSSDLTVYNCYEGVTATSVAINITDSKWNEQVE